MESRVERRERERREEARREAARRERIRNRTRELERELEYEEELERRVRTKRKGRKGRVGGVIALIIIILLLFTGFRVWMEMRPGAAEPIVIAGSGDFSDSRVNVLFLGSNQGLTDTIILFSFDSQNSRLDAISVPRDTYYPRSNFPGAAYQKINSVYSTEGYMGMSRAVSDVLGGVPIHYYVELDVKGAAKIIDAMGGVTMYVPIDMVYSDPDQNLYIDLRAGNQHLNGAQAIQFARFRSSYATGDLGRIGAQQELLKAVLAQSAGLDFPKIAVVARAETNTNMSIFSQAALAAKAAGISGGTFKTHMIPGSSGMRDGLSYYFHDAEATGALVRGIYNNE